MSECEEDEEEGRPIKRAKGVQLRGEVDGARFEIIKGEEEAMEPVHVNEMSDKFNVASEQCWGCINLVRPSDPNKDEELWQIWRLYDTAKGKMHDMAVCERIEEFFNEAVVNRRKAQGQTVMLWPARLIYAHFVYHVLSPKSIHLFRLRKQRDMLSTLDGLWLKRKKNGEYHVDDKVLAQHREAQKVLNAMQQINVDKLVDLF